MAIVRGEPEIYLHSSRQCEWDSCAAAAVAPAHGVRCSWIDGSPLSDNRSDAHLLACRREHAARLPGAVATLAF